MHHLTARGCWCENNSKLQSLSLTTTTTTTTIIIIIIIIINPVK
ncbi:MAG: hypothetical protein ACJ71H_07385 [Nitrososphaeraceae archaeon]